MSMPRSPVVLSAVLDRFVLCTRQQQVLRVVPVAASAVFVVAVAAAGGGFHPVAGLVALALAALVALAPESAAAFWLVLFLGALWVLAVPRGTGPWLLVAAAALAVLHLATTLACSGPPGLDLDVRLLRRWSLRAGLCVVAAVALWSVAAVLRSRDLRPAGDLLAIGLILSVAGAAFATARLRGPFRASDRR
jgi:hypothetical protein